MMKNKFKEYKTIIFDCDGVVLDSNKLKSNAFYDVGKIYSEKAALELVDYHKANGGKSRYLKFNLFLKEILPKYINYYKKIKIEELLNLYTISVEDGLLNCNFSQDLIYLNKHREKTKWAIVSGGDQKELNNIFKKRGLEFFFDAGIFGSPDNKEVIIKREFKLKNFISPALFIGDSKYDYEAARSCDLDFVFLNKWTEFKDWENFTSEKNILVINNLGDLLNL